jgi:hypothetical protein
VVEDGIVPGLLGFEAVSVVGDHAAWFVEVCRRPRPGGPSARYR